MGTPLRSFLGLDGSDLARDGLWTLVLNLAGKSQSIVLITAGAVAGGLIGVGQASAALGCGALGAGLVDFGLASETGRYCSAHPDRAAFGQATRTALPRALPAFVVGPVLLALTVALRQSESAVMFAAVSLYCAGLFLSGVGASLMYAFRLFRPASVKLGTSRAAGSVLALLAAVLTGSPGLVVLGFGVAEMAGAVRLLLGARRAALGSPVSTGGPPPRMGRSYLWLGASGIINTLVNQSDVVLVSALADPRVLGAFSIASQLQNAVGTLALSASSPVPMYVARALRSGLPYLGAVRQAVATTLRLSVLMVVGGCVLFACYAVVLTPPVILRGGRAMEAVFICLLASIPSALAGVYFGVAVGGRRYRSIGLARVCVGLAALVSFVVLTRLFGLLGAAAATLIRDCLTVVLANRCARQVEKISEHLDGGVDLAPKAAVVVP